MSETHPLRLVTSVGATLAVVLLMAGCATPAAGPTAAPSTPSGAATPTPAVSPPAGASVPLADATPTAVTTDLETPWSIVFRGGTALVSERDTGRILEIAADGSSREIGTVPGIRHGGEGGLLGLAVDDQERLYAYSTGGDGNRIQRFTVTGEPGALELGASETLLEGLASADIHNGGRIAFGPDGMLYAGVGDAGRVESSQDLNSLSGKILRMTPDGGVPADNPFPGSLVYSYGHRNVQGLGWASDGTMFASEFGQNTWDELNIIESGGNYGWPDVEGVGGGEEYVDPVQQWNPAEASPSGIAVVGGTVFIANLRGEVLRAVPVADPSTATDYYSGDFGRFRAVAPAPDGTLWFLTGNTASQVGPREDDDRILSVELSGGALR